MNRYLRLKILRGHDFGKIVTERNDQFCPISLIAKLKSGIDGKIHYVGMTLNSYLALCPIKIVFVREDNITWSNDQVNIGDYLDLIIYKDQIANYQNRDIVLSHDAIYIKVNHNTYVKYSLNGSYHGERGKFILGEELDNEESFKIGLTRTLGRMTAERFVKYLGRSYDSSVVYKENVLAYEKAIRLA